MQNKSCTWFWEYKVVVNNVEQILHISPLNTFAPIMAQNYTANIIDIEVPHGIIISIVLSRQKDSDVFLSSKIYNTI